MGAPWSLWEPLALKGADACADAEVQGELLQTRQVCQSLAQQIQGADAWTATVKALHGTFEVD